MLGVKRKPAPVDLIYWKKETKIFSLIEYDLYQAPSLHDGVRSATQRTVSRGSIHHLHALPCFLRFPKISEEYLHYLHLLAVCSHLLMCTISATPSLYPWSLVVYNNAHGHYQIQLLWKMRGKKLKFNQSGQIIGFKTTKNRQLCARPCVQSEKTLKYHFYSYSKNDQTRFAREDLGEFFPGW